MLQLSVLVLQLLQLLGFTAVHPTVLRLPAVVRLLRDPVLPAQLRCCQSCLALLQDRDDLLFAVSRAFHCGSPLLVWENSHSRWSGFRGLGHLDRLTGASTGRVLCATFRQRSNSLKLDRPSQAWSV